MKIKTGDMVRVLAGADKGKQGKVMQVFPALNKVVVEGLNLTTKHVRGTGKQPGKKVEYAAPIHLSNVAPADKDGSGRVGYALVKDGDSVKKTRVLRKAGTARTL